MSVWGFCMSRILIVDDSAVNRNILRNILEKEGYDDIAEAEDGDEGLDEYLDKLPDIVILDISMPGISGIELLKHIKAHDPGARVIMLSADGQQKVKDEAASYGANEYITKPYQISEIMNAVKRCS